MVLNVILATLVVLLIVAVAFLSYQYVKLDKSNALDHREVEIKMRSLHEDFEAQRAEEKLEKNVDRLFTSDKPSNDWMWPLALLLILPMLSPGNTSSAAELEKLRKAMEDYEARKKKEDGTISTKESPTPSQEDMNPVMGVGAAEGFANVEQERTNEAANVSPIFTEGDPDPARCERRRRRHHVEERPIGE